MTAEATRLARPLSDRMQAALDLPNGARFYRCALQVNPFAYLARHNKTTAFTSEDDYNEAIIESCLETGIEVIAVTDHYRVKHSASLVRAARDAGLYAFGGFEAVTKDGVHFLCLFDPDKDDVLERFIGECGIHDTDQPSPTGSKDAIELLECAKNWGAVCIAAHVASEGGLLNKLSGQSRINVWTNPGLLACALPGPVSDAPDELQALLDAAEPGAAARKKTQTVLNRLWLAPRPELAEFADRGVRIFKADSSVSVAAMTWGMAIASYPFFGKVSELVGRLSALQGDCASAQVQRRISETYGERASAYRVTNRVLQSQANWRAIKRAEKGRRLVRLESIAVSNERAVAWLLEAALCYVGKPVSLASLSSLAAIYPFALKQPLAYVASKSPRLELRSQGAGNQCVCWRVGR